jgi:hypothetical protein
MKWLAQAVAIWMLVETTTAAATPIVAASVSSPAPMLAKFHTLETPAAGHRRLLSKVIASNWEELKTKCEAGGNEVTLSSSFDGSVYPGQIDFSGKTCVIIGQGQTLDAIIVRFGLYAEGAGRFFYANQAGSLLEVHGLVLKNGYAGESTCTGGTNWGSGCNGSEDCPGSYCKISSGGAIEVYRGTVEVYDSTFESNTATLGGAIFISTGGTLVIHDSTFDTNTAARRVNPASRPWWEQDLGNPPVELGRGGALFSKGGDLQIYDSTFQSNIGGAIAAIQCEGCGDILWPMKIYNTMFQSNSALICDGGPNAGNACSNDGDCDVVSPSFCAGTGGAPDIDRDASASVIFTGCVLGEPQSVQMTSLVSLFSGIPGACSCNSCDGLMTMAVPVSIRVLPANAGALHTKVTALQTDPELETLVSALKIQIGLCCGAEEVPVGFAVKIPSVNSVVDLDTQYKSVSMQVVMVGFTAATFHEDIRATMQYALADVSVIPSAITCLFISDCYSLF